MLQATGSALVANTREVNVNPNQALPEVIRVEALKGFRASVNGQYGVVNPGDVVEVPLEVAIDLRTAHKAVMTQKELRRQTTYLPERKRKLAAEKMPEMKVAEAPRGGDRAR